jgi:hypothetical protein
MSGIGPQLLGLDSAGIKEELAQRVITSKLPEFSVAKHVCTRAAHMCYGCASVLPQHRGEDNTCFVPAGITCEQPFKGFADIIDPAL